MIEHRDVAVLKPGTRLDQQVRRLGHRLLATGHDDVELAGPDQLIGHRDRVKPGQAYLVNRQGRHVHADAGVDRRLPGRDLAGAGRQHLTHDDVLHLLWRHTGAFERGLDGETTQLGSREIFELAEQATHWGTGAGHDDRTDHTGHD